MRPGDTECLSNPRCRLGSRGPSSRAPRCPPTRRMLDRRRRPGRRCHTHLAVAVHTLRARVLPCPAKPGLAIELSGRLAHSARSTSAGIHRQRLPHRGSGRCGSLNLSPASKLSQAFSRCSRARRSRAPQLGRRLRPGWVDHSWPRWFYALPAGLRPLRSPIDTT